jgi:hypothetical protein
MPYDQIEELGRFSRCADKEARVDLAMGYIRDENDYTANFTGALRRIVNANSQTGLVVRSFLLSTALERKTGSDAVIVVESNGFIKIAAFEAKFPRFKLPNYLWDYSQSTSGQSHFSNQLERQHLYSEQIAFFEMFYCEYKHGTQPAYLKHDVSSCVWHDEAHYFDLNRTNPCLSWSTADVITLFQKSNTYSIDHILEDVCNCKRGKPIMRPENFYGFAEEFGFTGQVIYIEANREGRE